MSDIYNHVFAQDSFVKANFSVTQFHTLFLGPSAGGDHKKPEAREAQKALKNSYERQDYGEMLSIIRTYLRTVPRIVLPIIYREFVEEVVPRWTYESFKGIVTNNRSIMSAIANNDTVAIERFVKAYKPKVENGTFYRCRQRGSS